MDTLLRSSRRPLQLLVGLWLYGATMALMVRAGLGLDPWDVFHQGLTEHLGISFGAVVAIVGAVVLLAWIPLKQRPGIGTILNIVVIAIAVDVTLGWVPVPSHDAIEWRTALLVTGILGNGLAAALYVGAGLGAGPRDGLWVAIVDRTGVSIRIVRTVMEVTVLSIGFALGGNVNIGTVAYALAIGPIVGLLLPLVQMPPVRTRRRRAAETSVAESVEGRLLEMSTPAPATPRGCAPTGVAVRPGA
jgi:uncharacterized membrane protein YczE